MPQARILINAVPGSDDDVPINVLVQLNNQSLGDETSYTWAILDQPPGTTDVLSATNVQNPSFTPRKEGTYLVKLTVDLGLPTEQSDTQIIAVRQLKTRERIPAAGESTQDDAADGWAASMNSLLRRIDALLSDPGILVGVAGAAALARGSVLRVTSGTTIKSGLPGQETVPTFSLALGSSLTQTDELLCIMEGDVSTGGTPASGALCKARYIGRCANVFVSGGTGGAGGDTVYLSDAGIPSLTSGTIRRQIGSVMANLGAGYYDLWFDGVGGYDITPIDRGYLLYGPPSSGMVNAKRIDGTNATGSSAGVPYTFVSGDNATPSLVAKSKSGQTANIFEAQYFSGTVFVAIDQFGNLTFPSNDNYIQWTEQVIREKRLDSSRFVIGRAGYNLNAFVFTTTSTQRTLEVWSTNTGTVAAGLRVDVSSSQGYVGTLTAHAFNIMVGGVTAWQFNGTTGDLYSSSNRAIFFGASGTSWAMKELSSGVTPFVIQKAGNSRTALALWDDGSENTFFAVSSTESGGPAAQLIVECNNSGGYTGIYSGGAPLPLYLGVDGSYYFVIQTDGVLSCELNPLTAPAFPRTSGQPDVADVNFLSGNGTYTKRYRFNLGIGGPWSSPSPRYPSDSAWSSGTDDVYPSALSIGDIKAGSAVSTNYSLGLIFFLPLTGRLSFAFRAACNAGDSFRCYIDGVQVVTQSGNSPVIPGGLFVSAPLAAGVHYADWRFQRNASAAYGSQQVAITDVSVLTEGEFGAMARGMLVFDESWAECQNATVGPWFHWNETSVGGGIFYPYTGGFEMIANGLTLNSTERFDGPIIGPPVNTTYPNSIVMDVECQADLSGHGVAGAYEAAFGLNPEIGSGGNGVYVKLDETIVSMQTYLTYGDWPTSTTDYQIAWTGWNSGYHRYTLGVNPAGTCLCIDGKALLVNQALAYDTIAPFAGQTRGYPFFAVKTIAAGTVPATPYPSLFGKRLLTVQGPGILAP